MDSGEGVAGSAGGPSPDYRRPVVLGRTGLTVSRLGLASGYGVPAEAVDRAYRHYGVNYFYWGSRRGAGMAAALRQLARTERDRIVIALQTYDHLGIFMGPMCERGLRTLGIDYADVLILGWFNRPPRGRVLDAALKLKKRGLVRFLAMSGHNRRTFGRLARRTDSPIDIFMVRYNAVHRGAEEDIFPFLAGEDRPGVTTYTATCWGRLLDPTRMPAGERPLTAADCYRFALTSPFVDLCLTGPRSTGQMEEGLAALEGGPLSAAEEERIRRIGDHLHRKRGLLRRPAPSGSR